MNVENDSLGFVPVERRTLTDMTVDRIKVALERGLLQPGKPYTQRRLQVLLNMGTSRVPLVGALERLKGEGIALQNERRRYLFDPTERRP
jgi:DNA-binding GntR family transcriptional regulator